MAVPMRFFLLLLLPSSFSVPIRVRRGGVDAGIRVDPVAPSLTELVEDPSECYFKHRRSTSYEDVENRPKTSAVGPCNGALHRMSELFDAKVENLYQAPNPLALVLIRGEGDFETDWSNEAHVTGVGQRHICQRHIDELLLHWDSSKYYHMKRKTVRGSRVPACSMPHPPFFAHETIQELSKTRTHRVEADEAEAILVEKRVLVHAGLPICDEHNNLAKKTLADFIVKKAGHRIRPRVFRNGLSDTPDIRTTDYTLGQFSRFLELVAPQKVCTIVDETVADTMEDNANGHVQSMGWALPPKRKSVRFTERSKNFIRAIFDQGARTGVKTDPRSAAQMMKESIMGNGQLAFLPEELISARQTASLFSTFNVQSNDLIWLKITKKRCFPSN